jgi:hypothetical protein
MEFRVGKEARKKTREGEGWVPRKGVEARVSCHFAWPTSQPGLLMNRFLGIWESLGTRLE